MSTSVPTALPAGSLPEMRAFFIEFATPFWVRPARDLRNHHQVVPVLWTAMRNMRETVETEFPGVVFLDLADVKRNVAPPQHQAHCHASFDPVCQHVWQEMAQLVFDQYHRWDRADDFTTLQRTEHFYEALVYWNSLILDLKPDAVVFRNAPHAIYDLIILGIARTRGIRTLMYHHTNLVPYSIVAADLDRGINPFLEGVRMARWELQAGRKPGGNELSAPVRATLAKMRGVYANAVPYYQLPSLSQSRQGVPFRRWAEIGWQLSQTFRKELGRWLRRKDPGPLSKVNRGSMAKERGKSLRDSYFGHFTVTRYEWARIVEMRKNRRLARLYAELAHWDEDDPPEHFVYMPLSYQPETTSNPHGGIFAQQILMANCVANALPKGWTLLVREHPAQFNIDYAGQTCRDAEFYRILAAMPRTRLVPIPMDPFMLIDRCEAVATLVGTTGWEALVRGKSALVFGEIWYDRAPGAFRVRSTEDCSRAFAQIQGGIPAQTDLFHDFVKELDFSAIQAGGDLEVADPGTPTSDAQLVALREAAARVLDRDSISTTRVSLSQLLKD